MMYNSEITCEKVFKSTVEMHMSLWMELKHTAGSALSDLTAGNRKMADSYPVGNMLRLFKLAQFLKEKNCV